MQYHPLPSVTWPSIVEQRCCIAVNNNYTVGEDDRLYSILTDHSSMVEELSACVLHPAIYYPVHQLHYLLHWVRPSSWGYYGLPINNNVTDEACDAIIMAIKKNTSLVELHIYDNPISGECANSLL